jgi:hypothetical protein
MIDCTCLVQDGQAPARKQASLQRLLTTFAERAFGQPANVRWIAVRPGSGFTAAELSTSSVVSMTAPEPIAQDERVSLLTELCDVWMRETGCSPDEIVAVISDPQNR